ncbi:MAG: CocE/NonD family hydrolase [Alistipes sp.]|nr:CocE/NonD family hydrolase [Alistipes sp.]
MRRRVLYAVLAAVLCAVAVAVSQSAYVRYQKREYRIPMRDGVHLHTVVYAPRYAEDAPILICRTPYSCEPYGDEFPRFLEHGYYRHYTRAGYILVFQDVRGRFMSEGEFENVRPATGPISEESDSYDTVEWLLQNIKGHNGRVGFVGCSYPGFYAMCGGLCSHPAVKAVSPQAPITDWFMGDDVHHNGVMMIRDSYAFMPMMSHTNHTPTTEWLPTHSPADLGNLYQFFAGATRDSLRRMMHPSTFWDDMSAHPDYDEWWQERDLRRRCNDIRPAVLVVGGTFDAEDCFGAWNLYKAIRRQSPQTRCHLVIGPWAHGAWKNYNGARLGDFDFGRKASCRYFVRNFERPFFDRHLRGDEGAHDIAPVSVFISGSNRWIEGNEWPLDNATTRRFYLAEQGQLSEAPSPLRDSYSEYVSDPSHPVPYSAPEVERSPSYMIADQRFTTEREDVLTFLTEPLTEDITLAGEAKVSLTAEISTTDADFAVRLIDRFPAEDAEMPDYRMLVRADIMRGRYRHSFSEPKAMLPDSPTLISFTMPDIAHTFRRGHRIMVCVQSSWAPIAERSPQQFINLWSAKPEEFIPCRVRIHHSADHQSSIECRELRVD